MRRATDLSEDDWHTIRHFFPEPEGGPKNRRTPIRVLINATLYRLENNVPLRMLPPDFPPWGSVHAAEQAIKEQGLWPVILRRIGRDYLLPELHKVIRKVDAIPEQLNPRITVEGQNVEGAPE